MFCVSSVNQMLSFVVIVRPQGMVVDVAHDEVLEVPTHRSHERILLDIENRLSSGVAGPGAGL